MKGREQLTERPVADPAEEGKSPPEAREEAQLKYPDIVTPARERERRSVSSSFRRLCWLPLLCLQNFLSAPALGIGTLLNTDSQM